jgi:hypothetical protein
MKMHIPGMIRDTGSFAGGATHGKGGGGAQTSTVNQSNLPAYARPYFERIMNRSEAASNRPYEAYPGQRVAEASNDMNASYQGARNLQNTYLPSFNQASEAYTDALGQAGRAVSGYDPNGVDWAGQREQTDAAVYGYDPNIEMFGQDAAQRYMNPYIGNVISQAQQATQQNFLESQGGRASQAVKSGAFGGSRATIADEVARRTYDSQFQSLTADLLDKGYSNAQAQFMADRTARDNANQYRANLGLQGSAQNLQSMSAQDAANQYRAKLGMEGAAFGLEAGQRMQGLGESAFGMAGKQANLLNTYGQQQQALQQQGLNQAYEDFANQRDAERQNINFLSGNLRGFNVTPQSNSITYAPSGTSVNQALGLGIAGLGAVNAAK